MRPSPLRKSRGSDRSRSPSQVRAAATRKPLFVHWVEPFCTASGIQRDAFQVRLSRPLALCKQSQRETKEGEADDDTYLVPVAFYIGRRKPTPSEV